MANQHHSELSRRRFVAAATASAGAALLNPPGYVEIEKRLAAGITEVYEGKKNARQMVTELAGAVNELIKTASKV